MSPLPHHAQGAIDRWLWNICYRVTSNQSVVCSQVLVGLEAETVWFVLFNVSEKSLRPGHIQIRERKHSFIQPASHICTPESRGKHNVIFITTTWCYGVYLLGRITFAQLPGSQHITPQFTVAFV